LLAQPSAVQSPGTGGRHLNGFNEVRRGSDPAAGTLAARRCAKIGEGIPMARTGDDTWDMAHACTAAAAICHYIAMWFVVF
jgi:hypothetical protein